jgi:hypothetical protein
MGANGAPTFSDLTPQPTSSKRKRPPPVLRWRRPFSCELKQTGGIFSATIMRRTSFERLSDEPALTAAGRP